MPNRTLFHLMGVVPNGAVFSANRIIGRLTETQLTEARQAFLLSDDAKLTELTRIMRQVGLLANNDTLIAGDEDNTRNLAALGEALFTIFDGINRNLGRAESSGSRKGPETDLSGYIKPPTAAELDSLATLHRLGRYWRIRKDSRPGPLAIKNGVTKTVILGGNPNDVNAQPGHIITENFDFGQRDIERINTVVAVGISEHTGFIADILVLFREYALVICKENEGGVWVTSRVLIPDMCKYLIIDWKRSVTESSNVMMGSPRTAFRTLTSETGTSPTVREATRLAHQLPQFVQAMMIAIYEAVAQIYELQNYSFEPTTLNSERDQLAAARLKTVDVIADIIFKAILTNAGSMICAYARVAGLPSGAQDVNHGLKIAAIQTWSRESTYQNYENAIGARNKAPGSDVANDSMVRTLNETSCSFCGAHGHLQSECLYWLARYPSGLARAIQAQDTAEYVRLSSGYTGAPLASMQTLRLPVPTVVKDKNGTPCYAAFTLPKRLYQ